MKKALFIILLIICLGPLNSCGDDCTEGDCLNGQGFIGYGTGHNSEGIGEGVSL